MTATFVLVGHDNPFGRYPAPVVAVGRYQESLVTVFADSIPVFEALPESSNFIKHEPTLAESIGTFDPMRQRLFAFDETHVVAYAADSEKKFFADMLANNAISSDSQFLRFELSKATGLLDTIQSELRRTLIHLARLSPPLVDSWYALQLEAVLRMGIKIPTDWRQLLQLSGASVGGSIKIDGDVSAGEDFTVDGAVTGTLQVKHHTLTVGPNGRVKAKIAAKVVIVHGVVDGQIVATERIDIRDGGAVDGDLTAPRVAIAEGARFRGSVDMTRPKGGESGRLSASSSDLLQLTAHAGRSAARM